MPTPTRLWQLRCPACSHTRISANADMVARMRTVGMLKREKMPDATLLDALLAAAAPRLTCDVCGQRGLTITPFEDEWEDFEAGRACEKCGSIIPVERLQALPDTRRCARCQQQEEAGGDQQREFCPHCGGLMKMRSASQGGLARYVMTCSSCGRS